MIISLSMVKRKVAMLGVMNVFPFTITWIGTQRYCTSYIAHCSIPISITINITHTKNPALNFPSE